MRDSTNMFQAAVQSALTEQNLRKWLNQRSSVKEGLPQWVEESMEIDHVFPQKKCFLCRKVGYKAKHCQLRSISAVHLVTPSETTNVHCWWSKEKGHYKRVNPNSTKSKKKGQIQENYSTQSMMMPIMRQRELKKWNLYAYTLNWACRPSNSCLVKINNRKYWALLDSAIEVSLIYTKLYNLLKVKLKLNMQNALLRSIEGGSIQVDAFSLIMK